MLRPGLERELSPPPRLAELERRARVLPSEVNLHELALEIAGIAVRDPVPATAVRVEVWRTRFDPETLAPSSRPLRTVVVQLGGE